MKPFLPPTLTGRPRSIPLPKVDPKTECWIWQGASSEGYGNMAWNGGKGPERAHRVYYQIVHGPIPPKGHIHHKCKNRICVNPAHLTVMSNRAHGRITPNAKVTLKQVREIRRRSREGEGVHALAREFDMTPQHMSGILAGRVWQDECECPNCGFRFEPYNPHPLF